VTAAVGCFPLLAVLVDVAHKYPALKAGAGALEAGVVRLYGVVVLLDAGVPKRAVEDARQSLKDNARKLSQAAKRFWELSGAYCAVVSAATP
jgi:hypothetical protein